MSEQLVQSFDDGHHVRRDTHQWIIQHPHSCVNAKRGTQGAYTRCTYLTSESGFQAELSGCHLKLSQA